MAFATRCTSCAADGFRPKPEVATQEFVAAMLPVAVAGADIQKRTIECGTIVRARPAASRVLISKRGVFRGNRIAGLKKWYYDLHKKWLFSNTGVLLHSGWRKSHCGD